MKMYQPLFGSAEWTRGQVQDTPNAMNAPAFCLHYESRSRNRHPRPLKYLNIRKTSQWIAFQESGHLMLSKQHYNNGPNRPIKGPLHDGPIKAQIVNILWPLLGRLGICYNIFSKLQRAAFMEPNPSTRFPPRRGCSTSLMQRRPIGNYQWS